MLRQACVLLALLMVLPLGRARAGDFIGTWREYALWTGLAAGAGAIEHWPVNASHPLLPSNQAEYIEKERVPNWLGALGAIGFAGGIWLADSPARTHAHGYVTALGANALVTAVAKSVAGRKRPNYEDARARGLADETDTKSFWSGHSSSSFCMATYATLFIRGRTGNPWWRVAGPVALYSGAAYVAWTRVVEHRHHVSDVAVGAIVGTVTAATVFRWYDRAGSTAPSRAAVVPAGRGIAILLTL